MDISCQAIGVIHSCFKDKFGVPRQPGLIEGAYGELELFPPYNREEAFTGLEVFSHIWITFVFHHCLGQEARLSVRPPRLGGNKKVGVFASRATHRPNPIGLSVVALDAVEREGGKVRLKLSGLDLVDGTPVIDVKPYLPYADGVENARGGYADQAPESMLSVVFVGDALTQSAQLDQYRPRLRELICSVLEMDPRPAYRKHASAQKDYAVSLYDLDIHWRVRENGVAEVFKITQKTL